VYIAFKKKENEMELYDLVIPLGIAAYILIVLAILTGKRVIKLKPVYHRLFAWSGLFVITIHAAIVIYYNL